VPFKRSMHGDPGTAPGVRVGCVSDGILNLVASVRVWQRHHHMSITALLQENCHGRNAWSRLVHSVPPSAGSEVNLMLATRRYDVSHNCVIVTVQTGRSSSGTRPDSSCSIEEAVLPPVRTILSFPYSHHILHYSLTTRNPIYVQSLIPNSLSLTPHTHNHASRRPQNGLQVDQSSQTPSARPPQPAPERPFPVIRSC
jgi:hypothetical protein